MKQHVLPSHTFPVPLADDNKADFVIETARLRLRRWQKQDLLPFIELNADPEVRAYFNSTLTPLDSMAEISRYEENFDTHGYGVWVVELKETLEFIGTVGFEPYWFPMAAAPVVAIGWKLLKRFWGNDYAYEAASAAIDYAFDVLKVEEIVAMVPKANTRSARLMRRLGLTWDE